MEMRAFYLVPTGPDSMSLDDASAAPPTELIKKIEQTAGAPAADASVPGLAINGRFENPTAPGAFLIFLTGCHTGAQLRLASLLIVIMLEKPFKRRVFQAYGSRVARIILPPSGAASGTQGT